MASRYERVLPWIKRYLRYVDYIGAAQLYLKDNYLLKHPLKNDDIKPRILGHWGTVPGLNLIYASLNYLISQKKCEMLFVTGPGHGAPANLANLFAEKTISEFYPEFTYDLYGMGKLIHDFSWPYTRFPSHVTPSVPGSILEGGELGYSLATAFGAALDNPNLIVSAVIGDGEAETGPIATAWHLNKFLNPKTSGAVLPIVHINGFKISNPTLFGSMSDKELHELFWGYGYQPMVVKGPALEENMLAAVEAAYNKIRAIQTKARSSKAVVFKPRWPVILLRSPKGWKGIHQFGGKLIEGTFHAHGIPIDGLQKDPKVLKAVEQWLKSYRVHELVDAKGRPSKEVMEFVPTGKYRMGSTPYAIGGNLCVDLKIPALSAYETKITKRGDPTVGSTGQGGKLLRDIFKINPKNFRVFCPDELESNKLGAIFEATKRAYIWPIPAGAEHLSQDGRAMEVLSEHNLQGMMQGYLLTGRYGFFATYEAFAMIIASMVDQYAKFLKQSFNVPWRKPVPPAVYLMTSVGWRQEHNGYSHQNPGFVSNVLQKHGQFCQIYYPPDANSLLVALDESFSRKNSISVIVAEKREMPQWLSLKEAREQAKAGMGAWEWVGGKEGSKNPDVVLASAGDTITQEALKAVELCRELAPELKVRYVNVSELTSLSLGGHELFQGIRRTTQELDGFFTADRPVVFSYHGYVHDLEHILWPYTTHDRFSLHGYDEKGSTTTPFDMALRNGVSAYQLAMDLIERGSKRNKAVAKKKASIFKTLQQKVDAHREYICEFGDDPDSIKNLRWK
jgi:xylulose-5-phosphate/fructose-6-phosphate phosphoketolase